MKKTVVRLDEFSGKDTITTYKNALQFCREHPHTTLIIPPGRHVVRDEAAVILMQDAMAGKMGNNPQETIFAHYFPYSRCMDFSGCEDITVEAYGAWLVCDGWMEPVSIENCKNITIKGLTIDYLRKPYSVGTVIHEEADSYDVRFEESYPVTAAIPSPRIYAYLHESGRFSSEGWDCEKKELLAPQTLRFYGQRPDGLRGKTVIVWHSFHFRPAIFIHEAVDTRLHEVTIHSQPGMGIVGHRAENIYATGLRIIPEAGELLSTNTDATHFTSCKGDLSFESCQFEGHGDDAINVHNYYYTIHRHHTRACDLIVEEADAHAQMLDYPDVSDTLELVCADTLATVRSYTVTAVEGFPAQWRACVTLDDALPEDCSGYYLVNVTRLPKLRFIGCHVKNHLARAVLIKTRDVLVEGCTFEDSMGTAIHIAAEGGWREGIPAADVTIRNNRMLRCGHGNQGRIMGASAVCINIDAPKEDTPNLHRNILIENNIIVGEDAPQGIYISCAQDVTVRNNEIAGCREPIQTLHSSNVTLTNNPIR